MKLVLFILMLVCVAIYADSGTIKVEKPIWTQSGSENDFVLREVPAPKILLTIKPDGSIEKGPGFTTNEEMAKKFWDAVWSNRPDCVCKEKK